MSLGLAAGSTSASRHTNAGKDRGSTNDGRQVVLILDDDELVTNGLSMGLEQAGRTVISCNDLESAQLVVETVKPSHIVADVRLTGSFAYEGLDFISYAKRHSPGSKVILMTGDAPAELQMEASQRGAVGFLQKPFGGRQLGALITMLSSGPANTGDPVMVRMPLLGEILGSADLYPVFQPIVRLDEAWPTFGYESLARYRTNSVLQNPALLFDYANRKQRVHELEFECIRRTIAAVVPALNGAALFMNIHPAVMSAGPQLLKLLEGLDAAVLRQVVLEITEHAALPETPAVFSTVDRIRALGVRFAFDDFGEAHSHLSSIGRIRPAFLKISQSFGTGFESDATRTKIVKNIVSIASDFGCQLILEGIEEASTAEAAADLGIPFGQGYLFGRPADVTSLHANVVPS